MTAIPFTSSVAAWTPQQSWVIASNKTKQNFICRPQIVGDLPRRVKLCLNNGEFDVVVAVLARTKVSRSYSQPKIELVTESQSHAVGQDSVIVLGRELHPTRLTPAAYDVKGAADIQTQTAGEKTPGDAVFSGILIEKGLEIAAHPQRSPI
ncbi:MAG: hypothetical protein HY674_22300 [Chloroflexi bacterium]|nr:hypothetical protein [Chloroflexota bacterium]